MTFVLCEEKKNFTIHLRVGKFKNTKMLEFKFVGTEDLLLSFVENKMNDLKKEFESVFFLGSRVMPPNSCLIFGNGKL